VGQVAVDLETTSIAAMPMQAKTTCLNTGLAKLVIGPQSESDPL
jgi:hypothetical protein